MQQTIQVDTRFLGQAIAQEMESIRPEIWDAWVKLREKTCVGAEWTGWVNFPEKHGFAILEQVKKERLAERLPYDCVVVVGIGGSYAGTKAMMDALSHSYSAFLPGRDPKVPIFYAGHQMSELQLMELVDVLEQRDPLVVAISKSGTTTEPAVAFRVIRKNLERKYGQQAAQRIIAITDPAGGALRRFATEQKYQTFSVPNDVGGRFSVLTAVGIVPLALAGYPVADMLHGAQDLYNEISAKTTPDHAVITYAAARLAAYQSGKKIEALAYAQPKLMGLIEWWKQLFGESEGKQHKGLFPVGLAYTTDLHSMGQYMQDGERHLLETFLSFENPTISLGDTIERRLRIPSGSNIDELGYLEQRFVEDINRAAMLGTKLAHFDGGVPCLEIKCNRLDAYTMGALFAFFQVACGIGAAVLGVNPYDQPGVESYKKNLFGLLGKPGFESLGQELKKRLTQT